MPRYYRRQRRVAASPFQNLLTLVLTFVSLFGLWQIFSQPGMLRFSFGITPTPVPTISPADTAPAHIEVLVFSIGAILFGVGGLIMLGIILIVAPKTQHPSNAPSVLTDRANQSVSAPAATMLPAQVFRPQTIEPSKPAPRPMSQASSDLAEYVVQPQPIVSNFPVSSGLDQSPTTQRPIATVRAESDGSQETINAVQAKPILTPQEKGFFWKLFCATQNHFYIFPQILLRDLFSVERQKVPYELRGMWQKGIADFVLADLETLEAVAVIELDDPSHRQADAYARDQRKDRFLDFAGIPILRFPSGQPWTEATIKQEIERQVVFMQRTAFLTSEECELFVALREISNDVFIFPKVSLKQIVRRAAWLSLESFKTLQDEAVDFLIAHPKYLGTQMVVELNDAINDCSEKIDLLRQAKIRVAVVSDGRMDRTQLRQMIQQHAK